MGKEKKKRVEADSRDQSTGKVKKIKNLQRLEGDLADELICDIKTGICGPARPKKVGET